MPLEEFTFITSLNANNPAGTDNLNQGDDHARGTKLTLLNSFPLIDDAVNCTPADLNQLAGTAATGTAGFNVTGMITMYFGAVAPNGWILCDGAAIDGAHAALIALVGALAPDLRGLFPRGTSPDAGVDPDGPRVPGAVQGDEFASHDHTIQLYNESGGTSGPGRHVGSTSGTEDTTSAGGNETRPKNMALTFIIKT